MSTLASAKSAACTKRTGPNIWPKLPKAPAAAPAMA